MNNESVLLSHKKKLIDINLFYRGMDIEHGDHTCLTAKTGRIYETWS
jgi:hypothetical protein